jgi:hypothetical protein
MLILSRQNPETDARRTTEENIRSRGQWNRDETPHGAAGELGENQESGLFATYRQVRAIPAPKAFEALSHLSTGRYVPSEPCSLTILLYRPSMRNVGAHWPTNRAFDLFSL